MNEVFKAIFIDIFVTSLNFFRYILGKEKKGGMIDSFLPNLAIYITVVSSLGFQSPTVLGLQALISGFGSVRALIFFVFGMTTEKKFNE